MTKRILLIFFSAILITWTFDITFNRTTHFEGHSADYKYYLFNNSFCNLTSFGHCPTNSLNRENAELKLYKQVCKEYGKSASAGLKNKIEGYVKSNEHLKVRYENLTSSKIIKYESINKYKDILFDEIALK